MAQTTEKAWTRRHDNGWVGVVSEVQEIGRFVAGAIPGGGKRNMGDYASLEMAKRAADQEVETAGGHPTCSAACESWPD